MDDNAPMDNSTMIPVNPINAGKKKHKLAAILAAVVLIVFLVFVFISYEGYVPFLKLSSPSNPYYGVTNVQQLSSAVSKLSNSSGPFNLSYNLLLSAGASIGTSSFSFNLPVNGYLAHFSPYTRASMDINLLPLLKDIKNLNSSLNLSSIPSFLYNINFTALSNHTASSLCVPFLMIAKAANTSVSVIGFGLNDSNANNGSLFCLSIKKNSLAGIGGNLSSYINNTNLNNTNLSAVNASINKYIQVKVIKGEVYNGNACSILDINTTAVYESKYNVSMGASFCFSNNYGMPLYGSFILNLGKESSLLSKGFNSTTNISSLVFSAQLKSTFNPAPSLSAINALPLGSYTLNSTQLSDILAGISFQFP
ncbi:MAG: hypothetical protein QXL94_06530 [Candidatus Parvarchaeum sp.]